MQSAIRNPQSALALLAALAVVLAAWLLPLPRLVLSDEEDAAKRMPEMLVYVANARDGFEKAESNYKGYIAAHNVTADLKTLSEAVSRGAEVSEVSSDAKPVSDYLDQLRAYALAGENYFAWLADYDNDLMAWTRSLNTASEALRDDTWPIVEYLKLYPPPTGLQTEYSNTTVAQIDLLLPIFAGNGLLTEQSVADVRAAGRSVEYIESLQSGYNTLLDEYHTKLRAIATNNTTPNISGGRAIVAYAANTLIAVTLIAALAVLFFPRRASPGEARK